MSIEKELKEELKFMYGRYVEDMDKKKEIAKKIDEIIALLEDLKKELK